MSVSMKLTPRASRCSSLSCSFREFQPRAALGFAGVRPDCASFETASRSGSAALVDFSLNTFPAEQGTQAQQQIIAHEPLLS